MICGKGVNVSVIKFKIFKEEIFCYTKNFTLINFISKNQKKKFENK